MTKLWTKNYCEGQLWHIVRTTFTL